MMLQTTLYLFNNNRILFQYKYFDKTTVVKNKNKNKNN